LVVVEGYMDVVLPHQEGHTDFVASLGTAFTPDHARLARRYVDEIVLLFDGDAAGAQATQRTLAQPGVHDRRRCFFRKPGYLIREGTRERNSVSSGLAWESNTPPPAKIMGRFALRSRLAARSTSF